MAARASSGWNAGRRERRASVAVLAAAHVLVVGWMLQARVDVPGRWPSVVELAITTPRLAPGAPLPSTDRRPPRTRTPAVPVLRAPLPAVAAEPVPQAIAVAPAPPVPASAASAPQPHLNLALTPEQLRAIASGGSGLAARLQAPDVPVSPLARLGGDDAPITAIARPHGVTEMHVHGECYTIVPTVRSQLDPFNHANETAVGNC